MKHIIKSDLLLSTLSLAGCMFCTATASASPLLGASLASFTVLGASTVTNVPTSTITGNVGVWSSGGANAVTGFSSSPGLAVADLQVTGGLVHAGTASGAENAMSSQSQLTAAIANLSSLGAGTTLPLADLVGLTLAPGVYTVPAGVTNLSGALTLDGQGNANATWVFQMPSTLITSPNSLMNVINTAAEAGVYWNVGSSATIDTNTTFIGNILALASITFNTSATDLCGRALAKTGAVTLDQNTLSGICSGLTSGDNGLSGGLDVTTLDNGTTVVSILPFSPLEVSAVPEPSSLALLGLGLVGLLAARRRAG